MIDFPTISYEPYFSIGCFCTEQFSPYPIKQSPMPKSHPMADVSLLVVVWMVCLQCGQSILAGSGPKLIGAAATITGAPGCCWIGAPGAGGGYPAMGGAVRMWNKL